MTRIRADLLSSRLSCRWFQADLLDVVPPDPTRQKPIFANLSGRNTEFGIKPTEVARPPAAEISRFELVAILSDRDQAHFGVRDIVRNGERRSIPYFTRFAEKEPPF